MITQLMKTLLTPARTMMFAGLVAAPFVGVSAANAEAAGEIDADVANAIAELKEIRPETSTLFDRAEAVLVVPEVTKASLVVGGAYGEGALLKDGATHSYWRYAAASFGFQAGAQQTRQVLFFMTDDALARFLAKDGFELGADAEATIIDQGAEISVDTTAETAPIIAVVYGRQGLLAGASLQGGKYDKMK